MQVYEHSMNRRAHVAFFEDGEIIYAPGCVRDVRSMNTVKFHLFKSCMDQYRDYLTMCDDPDRNETALALQRARVAAIYFVIKECRLEFEYAAFKEIMSE